MTGRPFRFLLLLLGGWTGARVAVLWQDAGSPRALAREVLTGRTAAFAPPAAMPAPRPRIARVGVASPRTAARVAFAMPAIPRHPPGDPERIQPAQLGFVSFGTASDVPAAAPPARASPAARWTPGAIAPPSRWSGSGWLLARGSGIAGTAPDGQIGGAQAGVRLAWTIAPGQRLAAFGRLAAPLRGRGREAAIGLEWQPGGLPIRLAAERRFALDGGRGGFGAGVVGGASAVLPLDFRLEGYGQAGAVRRAVTEPYVDGAVRIARPVAAAGGLRLDLGAGLWGAAQRDAQRLDLGPSLSLAVPAAERTVRLSLDWRQRIAGRARPGSGPALTLGTDF